MHGSSVHMRITQLIYWSLSVFLNPQLAVPVMCPYTPGVFPRMLTCARIWRSNMNFSMQQYSQVNCYCTCTFQVGCLREILGNTNAIVKCTSTTSLCTQYQRACSSSIVLFPYFSIYFKQPPEKAVVNEYEVKLSELLPT